MKAAGKGGQGQKHQCPPIPPGWDRRITGPAYTGPSYAEQGEQIARGDYVAVDGCKASRAWVEGTRMAKEFRRLLNSDAVAPMPSQRHGSRMRV